MENQNNGKLFHTFESKISSIKSAVPLLKQCSGEDRQALIDLMRQALQDANGLLNEIEAKN